MVWLRTLHAAGGCQEGVIVYSVQAAASLSLFLSICGPCMPTVPTPAPLHNMSRAVVCVFCQAVRGPVSRPVLFRLPLGDGAANPNP